MRFAAADVGSPNTGGERPASKPQVELSQTADLAAANRQWDYAASSFAGSPQSLLKRCALALCSFLRPFHLRPEAARYLEAEASFQGAVVRTLNQICRTLDDRRRSAEDDLALSLLDLERRLDEQNRRCSEEIQALQQQIEAREAVRMDQLRTLESVVRGLESIVARLGTEAHLAGTPLAEEADAGTACQLVDYRYLLLENRFRGSEEEIERRLEPYTAVFRGAAGPILEIGAGRGELQTLFRRANLTAYGLELDEAMVERCRGKGLDVRGEEGIAHLAGLADRTLGGLIAVQVIEHLPQPQLRLLLQLARAKTVPGGRIVLETINTESIAALCHNYFRDPTHVNPLHPATLQYLIEQEGLRVLEVRRLAPYPAEAVLQPLGNDGALTPRWAALVEAVNLNLQRLNNLLFGFQDYCIVAEV